MGYTSLKDMHKTLDEMEREILAAEKKAREEPTPVSRDSLLEHMPSSCHSILKVKSLADQGGGGRRSMCPPPRQIGYDPIIFLVVIGVLPPPPLFFGHLVPLGSEVFFFFYLLACYVGK